MKTVDQYGIHGTTMGRIAKGAGISQAALYVHFSSREEILSAVLDAIYEEIFKIQEVVRTDDAIAGLRESGQIYSRLVGGRRAAGHAHLLLEFVTSSRKYGLRDALKRKQVLAIKHLVEILEEGKHRGSVPEDLDSEQLAWMVAGWGWALDVAQLMGLRSSWYPSVSTQLLKVILESVTASEHPASADDQADPALIPCQPAEQR